MAHHKRRGPKSTRAGCMMCKAHKRQGAPLAERRRFSQTKRIHAAKQQIAERA